MSTCPAPPCPGCDALPSHRHHPDCDVARCRQTGLQRAGCDQPHDHGDDPWTGTYPGEAECRAFGWMMPAPFEEFPDLNRLYVEAVWDPHTGHWTRPATPDSPSDHP